MKSASAQPKVSNDKPATQQKPKEKAVESTSFAMNLFRGQLKLDEIFPYPSSLTEEQRENLQALVDPTAKFFEVVKLSEIFLIEMHISFFYYIIIGKK